MAKKTKRTVARRPTPVARERGELRVGDRVVDRHRDLERTYYVVHKYRGYSHGGSNKRSRLVDLAAISLNLTGFNGACENDFKRVSRRQSKVFMAERSDGWTFYLIQDGRNTFISAGCRRFNSIEDALTGWHDQWKVHFYLGERQWERQQRENRIVLNRESRQIVRRLAKRAGISVPKE